MTVSRASSKGSQPLTPAGLTGALGRADESPTLRPGLTPSRATRDKAMPAGPGRRRLSRLESCASESAAAVTHMLDKARAD